MPADTTAPVLTSLSLPSIVDVSGGDSEIIATVGAFDSESGIRSVVIEFDRQPSTAHGADIIFNFYDDVDSFEDGYSSSVQIISKNTESAVYNIGRLKVIDKSGNVKFYDKDDLEIFGFPTSLTVTGGPPPDTTPPNLRSLALPSSVDVSQDDTSFTTTLGIEDEGSGVDFVYVEFNRRGTPENDTEITLYFNGTDDSFSDGLASLKYDLPHDTVQGIYDIRIVRAYDKSGNGSFYDANDLASLGFQTSITVTNYRIDGTSDNDILTGTDHTDVIDGKSGADKMYGLGGNDTYYVDTAGDRVFEVAGQGTDRVASTVSYTLGAGQSIESLYLIDAASVTALNLTGNELKQSLTGNAGNNILVGGGGADTMRGLGGSDLYSVDNSGDLVFETAGGGTDRVASTVSYTLGAGQSIEGLYLSNAAATTALNLVGNELGQSLSGNAGNNLLDGKDGFDTLRGYGGNDSFQFSTALGAGNVDHIADFSAVDDTIRLRQSVFSDLGLGTLTSTAYKDIASGAIDANDRILYDHNTGRLYYDADGSGAGARTMFAILDNKPAVLTHVDFLVVA